VTAGKAMFRDCPLNTGRPFKTFDTVATETSASSAICEMVGRPSVRCRFAINAPPNVSEIFHPNIAYFVVKNRYFE
jgi:hypothetical protein